MNTLLLGTEAFQYLFSAFYPRWSIHKIRGGMPRLQVLAFCKFLYLYYQVTKRQIFGIYLVLIYHYSFSSCGCLHIKPLLNHSTSRKALIELCLLTSEASISTG